MSVSIKRLINERQRAFHSVVVPEWKTLKYKVQTEIALRKKECKKRLISRLNITPLHLKKHKVFPKEYEHLYF